MAACLLYSSSTSRLLRERMKRKTPPPIAAIATTPTTTPAAMPALFGPEEVLPVGVLEAVTTTVCAWPVLMSACIHKSRYELIIPPIVTTDGAADFVEVGADVGADVAEEDDAT